MLITDDPITDLRSNCKKNSILLSALNLGRIGTELLAKEIGNYLNEGLDFDSDCVSSRSEQDVY